MANDYKKLDSEIVTGYAIEYVDECIEATKQNLANTGKLVSTKDRKIPTIGFFCNHWIRKKDYEFYDRTHIYLIEKNEDHPLYDTIKRIRLLFDSLAEDVVANEGKGIFWAKNRLGMTDKQQIDQTVREQPLFKDE